MLIVVWGVIVGVTMVDLVLLLVARFEGQDFRPPGHVTRRAEVQALLRKVGTEPRIVRGQWGWYCSSSSSTVEAYVRVAGVWWQVPLWASLRALRVIAMEAMTGA